MVKFCDMCGGEKPEPKKKKKEKKKVTSDMQKWRDGRSQK